MNSATVTPSTVHSNSNAVCTSASMRARTSALSSDTYAAGWSRKYLLSRSMKLTPGSLTYRYFIFLSMLSEMPTSFASCNTSCRFSGLSCPTT